MQHIDAGHHLEHLAGHMRGRCFFRGFDAITRVPFWSAGSSHSRCGPGSRPLIRSKGGVKGGGRIYLVFAYLVMAVALGHMALTGDRF